MVPTNLKKYMIPKCAIVSQIIMHIELLTKDRKIVFGFINNSDCLLRLNGYKSYENFFF